MLLGKVSWFSRRKGYGFIRGEDGKEYFVHISKILMDGIVNLYPGQNVNFEVINTDNRQEAINVSSLDA